MIFGPLFVFLPTLVDTKRTGLKTYGMLAQRYVRDFDRKWVDKDSRPAEALLRQSGRPLARGSEPRL